MSLSNQVVYEMCVVFMLLWETMVEKLKFAGGQDLGGD